MTALWIILTAVVSAAIGFRVATWVCAYKLAKCMRNNPALIIATMAQIRASAEGTKEV